MVNDGKIISIPAEMRAGSLSNSSRRVSGTTNVSRMHFGFEWRPPKGSEAQRVQHVRS